MGEPLYSIRNWSETFLNDKTRGRRGRLKYVQLPVKLEDIDYIALAQKKDGASYLGVWMALIELAGTLESRDGRLCRSDGTPFDLHEMSLLTRLPMSALEKGLRALSEVGWLVSEPFGTIPKDHPIGEDRGEEKSGEEEVSAPSEPQPTGVGGKAALDLWNRSCAPLPKARTANRQRTTRLRAFLKEAGIYAEPAIRAAAADPFYRSKRYGIDTFLCHWARWLDAARNGDAVQLWTPEDGL